MKVLFDSNIVIDFLGGVESSFSEVDRVEDRAVSIMTWMEVLAGVGPEEEPISREFLGKFILLGVTPSIAEEAVRLRRQRKLKLPDAVIWATARVEGRVLVTRNTKDFPVGDPGIRVPYRL